MNAESSEASPQPSSASPAEEKRFRLTRRRYRAAPGREDRDGEMTGAIMVNMIMVLPLLTIWCIFIGPALIGIKATLWSGLVLAIALTIIGLPISQWVWAWFSDYADRF